MKTHLSRTGRFVLPTFSAAVLLFLTAASASSMGTWTGVTILEPGMLSSGPPEAPVVACDALGHAVAVWTSPSKGVVFTERYPGGSWSPANPILFDAIGDFPQVAIGSSGVVAASWLTPSGEGIPPKLVVSVRPVGGSFSTPIEVAAGVFIFESKLGVFDNGAVTIVWGDGSRIKTSMRNPDGAWSAAQLLSSTTVQARLPDLVINGAGAAVAVWQETALGGTGPGAIAAAYKPAPARSLWGTAVVISTGTGLQTWNPKAGIDAAGDAVIGYLDGNTMMLSTKAVTGRWKLPVLVSPASEVVGSSTLAMDSAGNVVTAWRSLDTNNYGMISERILSAAGAWGPAMILSTTSEDASYPTASIASNGSVASVTWVDNSTLVARAALGRLRGAWLVYNIGNGWWNTSVPIAAGSGAVSAVWAAPTGNPNVTNMVANVYTP